MRIRGLSRFLLALAVANFAAQRAAAGPSSESPDLPTVTLLAYSVTAQRAVLQVGDEPMQRINAGEVIPGVGAVLGEVTASGVVLLPHDAAARYLEIRVFPATGPGLSRMQVVRRTAPRPAIWGVSNTRVAASPAKAGSPTGRVQTSKGRGNE